MSFVEALSACWSSIMRSLWRASGCSSSFGILIAMTSVPSILWPCTYSLVCCEVSPWSKKASSSMSRALSSVTANVHCTIEPLMHASTTAMRYLGGIVELRYPLLPLLLLVIRLHLGHPAYLSLALLSHGAFRSLYRETHARHRKSHRSRTRPTRRQACLT